MFLSYSSMPFNWTIPIINSTTECYAYPINENCWLKPSEFEAAWLEKDKKKYYWVIRSKSGKAYKSFKFKTNEEAQEFLTLFFQGKQDENK